MTTEKDDAKKPVAAAAKVDVTNKPLDDAAVTTATTETDDAPEAAADDGPSPTQAELDAMRTRALTGAPAKPYKTR